MFLKIHACGIFSREGRSSVCCVAASAVDLQRGLQPPTTRDSDSHSDFPSFLAVCSLRFNGRGQDLCMLPALCLNGLRHLKSKSKSFSLPKSIFYIHYVRSVFGHFSFTKDPAGTLEHIFCSPHSDSLRNTDTSREGISHYPVIVGLSDR